MDSLNLYPDFSPTSKQATSPSPFLSTDTRSMTTHSSSTPINPSPYTNKKINSTSTNKAITKKFSKKQKSVSLSFPSFKQKLIKTPKTSIDITLSSSNPSYKKGDIQALLSSFKTIPKNTSFLPNLNLPTSNLKSPLKKPINSQLEDKVLKTKLQEDENNFIPITHLLQPMPYTTASSNKTSNYKTIDISDNSKTNQLKTLPNKVITLSSLKQGLQTSQMIREDDQVDNQHADESLKNVIKAFNTFSDYTKEVSKFSSPQNEITHLEAKENIKDLSAEKHNVEEGDLTDKTKEERTIFVGNLPLNETKIGELYQHLNIHSKDVHSIRFRSIPIHPKFIQDIKAGILSNSYAGTSQTHNAYIVLKETSLIGHLLSMNNTKYKGYTLRIDQPLKKPEFSTFDPKRTIFVGNLPVLVSDEQLRIAFTSFGSINGVRIIRDRATSLSKGFGFVFFQNRMAVFKALQANGTIQVLDRFVRITRSLKQEALKKQSSFPSSKSFQRTPYSKSPKPLKKPFGTNKQNVTLKKIFKSSIETSSTTLSNTSHQKYSVNNNSRLFNTINFKEAAKRRIERKLTKGKKKSS